jgi:GNAT superfamily N-acetyltransferase
MSGRLGKAVEVPVGSDHDLLMSSPADHLPEQATPTVFTVEQRPDLFEAAWLATNDLMPEYNNHGDVLAEYWPRLADELPEYQFHLLDDEDQILARARTVPVHWDGSDGDLPSGIDGALVRGFDGQTANTLCALLVAVPRAVQRRGVSAQALMAMADIARSHGYRSLIAPVRPSSKDRYPLVPIERYAAWRRPDGLLFDPWMRVHERLGATVIKPEAHSLRISGPVAAWEEWTGHEFPESGDYWFPGGLATVSINREQDQGLYFEPNVWMHHQL